MNKRLLMLNGLAILGVVINHASQEGFVAMFWWTNRYRPVSVPNYDQMGSLAYYFLVATQKLAIFSVPSFLFVTGIFIAYAARGSNSNLSWRIVGRRIVNLLVPYLIWFSIFYIGKFLIDTQHTPYEYLAKFLGILQSPFFYIPLLCEIYLVSPLVVPLAKHKWGLLLISSAIILLISITLSYLKLYEQILGIEPLIAFPVYLSTVITNPFFEYVFYYVLGLVAGFHLHQLKIILARLKWSMLIAVILFGVLAILEAEWAFRLTGVTIWRSVTLSLPASLYAITFFMGFLAFDNHVIPNSKFLLHLGSASLGIYLIQSTVLLFLPKIIYHVVPIVFANQYFYQFILVGFGVGGPLLLMAVVRRSPLSKIYRNLFG